MCKCIVEPEHLLPSGHCITEPQLGTKFNFCSYCTHGENKSSRTEFTNQRQTARPILAELMAGSCRAVIQFHKFSTLIQWGHELWLDFIIWGINGSHFIAFPLQHESHGSILPNLLHQLHFKKLIKGHRRLVWKCPLNKYSTKVVSVWKSMRDSIKLPSNLLKT